MSFEDPLGRAQKETPLRNLHIAISGVVPAARLTFPELLLEIVELVSYWVKLRCMPIMIVLQLQVSTCVG